MEDKIISLTKELKEELNSLKLFIEYKRVREAFINSEELNELKKLIVRAKNENRMDDYHLLKEKYDNHPLNQNYKFLEEEVANYLKEISDILNEK